MLRGELPLLLFTLLVQMALGAVLLAAVLPFRLARRGAGAESDLLVRRLLCWAVPALVLAMALSLSHLGTPGGAYRAIFNLKTSWLSREILFSGLFTLVAMLAAWAHWKGKSSRVLIWFSLLCGIVTVYSMARLYQMTIKPAWMTFFTPVSFFTAALMLGVATGALVLLGSLGRGQVSAETFGLLLGDLVATGAVVLVVQLVSVPFYVGVLSRGPRAAQAALHLLFGQYGTALGGRLGAGVLGVGVLTCGWYLLTRKESKPVSVAGLVYLSVAGIVTAEVLARVLFYAAGISISVG
ncbi:MAG TPA: DmsC/YnfH family molybdoenzyme membrane anchor subunit [Symbiobacteriaceae bacterium]|jgi:anaerobic dimethyl sulfoxide reductase subunit C (anchor subunit)